MKNFTEEIYKVVRSIPKGYVATYGQVAKLAGYPKAARAVGNVLHSNPDPIGMPCYKIVNGKGMLSENYAFGGKKKQKEFLEKDGIKVINYRVDLEKYQWNKK